MTLQQLLAFAVIAGMMVMFVWGRIRYDLVAGLACSSPSSWAWCRSTRRSRDSATTSSSSSRCIARERRRDALAAHGRPAAGAGAAHLLGARAAHPAGHRGDVLSAFVKNIGALAMMLPGRIPDGEALQRVAVGVPHADGVRFVVGRLMTLIGTSPNIIVSELRQELVGQPFAMFDFTPVGLGLAVLGIVFLAFALQTVAAGSQGRELLAEGIDIQDYVTEGRVGPKIELRGRDPARAAQEAQQGRLRERGGSRGRKDGGQPGHRAAGRRPRDPRRRAGGARCGREDRGARARG